MNEAVAGLRTKEPLPPTSGDIEPHRDLVLDPLDRLAKGTLVGAIDPGYGPVLIPQYRVHLFENRDRSQVDLKVEAE